MRKNKCFTKSLDYEKNIFFQLGIYWHSYT